MRRQKQQYIYNKHTTYYSARARATTIFQNGVLNERLLRNIFRRAIAPSRPATIKNISSRRRHQQNHSATGDRRSCDHQKTPQLFVSLWAIAIIAAVTGKIISAVANVFCSIFPKGDRDVATGGKIPSTASRRHRAISTVANRQSYPVFLAVPRVSLSDSSLRHRPPPRHRALLSRLAAGCARLLLLSLTIAANP